MQTTEGTPAPIPAGVTGVTYQCLKNLSSGYYYYDRRKVIRVRWTDSVGPNIKHRLGYRYYHDHYRYYCDGRDMYTFQPFGSESSKAGFNYENLTSQYADFTYHNYWYYHSYYDRYAISITNGVNETFTELDVNAMDATVCPANPPAAFSLTSATAGNGQVVLVWAAPSDTEKYTVKYGTSPGTYTNTIENLVNPTTTVTALTNGQTYYFKVTAINSEGSTDSSNELSATPSAAAAPGAFTLSSATAGDTDVVLTWTNSASATTYDVKYGTVSGTYTTTLNNQTSPKTVTGLTNGVTYYFRVTANNGAGSTDSTNQLSAMPSAAPTFKKIYVTNLTYTTDLSSGGMVNELIVADGFCASDTNKPAGGGTYKALFSSSARVACTTANCGGGAGEHTDWVLAANTEYRQADGTTVIGTTTATGIFSFPLDNVVSGSTTVMTGLNTDWTSSADNCTNWSTAMAGNYAVGEVSSTTNTLLNNGVPESCLNASAIMCVEQ